MRLTKFAVDNIPIPVSPGKGKTAQQRYYDDRLKGFGIRATSGGTKAFFVDKKLTGEENENQKIEGENKKEEDKNTVGDIEKENERDSSFSKK